MEHMHDDDDSEKIEISDDSSNGDLTCDGVYPTLGSDKCCKEAEAGRTKVSTTQTQQTEGSPNIWSNAKRAMMTRSAMGEQAASSGVKRNNASRYHDNSLPVEELYSVVQPKVRPSNQHRYSDLATDFALSGKFYQRAEIVTCFVFDILLPIIELAMQAALANQLIEAGRSAAHMNNIYPPYISTEVSAIHNSADQLETVATIILALLFLPSVCNAILWLGSLVRSSHLFSPHCRTDGSARSHEVGTWFMACLALFSLPSPLLVYVWFLYLAIFDSQSPKVASCKSLMSIFRLVHAVTCSVPVMIVNLYTLVEVAKVRTAQVEMSSDVTPVSPTNVISAMDVGSFLQHMGVVDLHGACLVISMVSALRAATSFNERQTWSVLYTMVSVPFHLFSLLARVVALALIIAFLDWVWIAVLFAGLIVTNIILLLVCRKSTRSVRRKGSYAVQKKGRRPQSGQFAGGGDVNKNYETLHIVSPDFAETTAVSPSIESAHQWVRYMLLAFSSILIPSGYANDQACFHPHLKGGLYIVLNYLFNMTWIGLALGLTILHYIPNTVHGISLPNPSIKIQVPDSRILVKSGVLDLNLALPSTEMDLGSMAPMSASVDTADYDAEHATAVALMLTLIVLPFVAMRAAFMELECFVFRKKRNRRLLRTYADQVDNHALPLVESRADESTLPPFEQYTRGAIHARVFVALCCSTAAMVLFTLMTIALSAVVISIHA